MTYQRSEYALFNDKINYSERFLTFANKTVPLKNVREVNLKRTIPQQLFGLGTVLVSTAATSSTGASGLKMTDLENPERIYSKIRTKIDRP